MKLSDAMVERAAESLCNSIGPEFDAWRWDRTEDGEQHRVQWRIDARAALEAALGQCEIISFGHSMRDEKPMRYEGKRVALVVLDD